MGEIAREGIIVDARSNTQAEYLLNDLLREVSRSFFLTLRLLPRAVRSQIGLAYLLARATDTIADTGAISIEKRLETLRRLKRQISSGSSEKFDPGEIQSEQSSDAERILLERITDALRLLQKMGEGDRQKIQRVLEIITSGQELDLERFGAASHANIIALRTATELDDYTYRVAGCVGEFWTRVCMAHLTPKPRVSLEELIAKGVRFGKGLQLVNILRDLPADLRLGRCYLPEERLSAAGLAPRDLLDPVNEQKFRPAYQAFVAEAEAHLKEAWSYTLSLPRSWVRVRLACALPVLIGVKTLNKLRAANVLNPDTRIKVSRSEVKQIVRSNVLFYPVNALWRKLPERILRN